MNEDKAFTGAAFLLFVDTGKQPRIVSAVFTPAVCLGSRKQSVLGRFIDVIANGVRFVLLLYFGS